MNTILGKRIAEDTFENPRKKYTNEEDGLQTSSSLGALYPSFEIEFISNPTYPIDRENPIFEEICELTHQVQLDILSDSDHTHTSPELAAKKDPIEPPLPQLKKLLKKKSTCDLVDFIEIHHELAMKHRRFIIENSGKNFLSGGAYRAISRNLPDAAIFLLNSGADPNWRNNRGKKNSLLQAAVSGQNSIVMRILLKYGATVDSYQNKDGNTILHLAKKHFRTNDAFIELVKKADEKATEILKIKNKDNKTPEEISIWDDNKGKVSFLEIQKNRDEKKLKTFVKGKSPDFLSARASSAINNRWFKALGIILDAGANIEWKLPQNGKTLLARAASIGHLNTTNLLLAYGAKIDTQDDNGDTPLHHAFRSGQPGVYELLIESAGNKLDKLLEIENKKGQTPEKVKQRVRKSQSKYK